MKRKIEPNRPPLWTKVPWRMMLGAVILCFVASVNSFGQTVADYEMQVSRLQQDQAYVYENGTAAEIQAYNDMVAALHSKIAALSAATGVAPSYDYQLTVIKAQLEDPNLTPEQASALTVELYNLQLMHAKLNGLPVPPAPTRN